MAIDYASLKKGGFMRQKQKGYFSLRLQVVGGTLTTENLRIIQEVADRYGHGYVHLTSRQGVEIPFVRYEDIEIVKAELAKGGCKPGVCGPRVRTVTACQGNAVCPSGNIDTYKIAEKLDERYYARELPHKFKFGVTGCQNNCLKAEENDLGIKGALDVHWDEEKCTLCGVCEKACRVNAIEIKDGQLTMDASKCNYCGCQELSFRCMAGRQRLYGHLRGTFWQYDRPGIRNAPIDKNGGAVVSGDGCDNSVF